MTPERQVPLQEAAAGDGLRFALLREEPAMTGCSSCSGSHNIEIGWRGPTISHCCKTQKMAAQGTQGCPMLDAA